MANEESEMALEIVRVKYRSPARPTEEKPAFRQPRRFRSHYIEMVDLSPISAKTLEKIRACERAAKAETAVRNDDFFEALRRMDVGEL